MNRLSRLAARWSLERLVAKRLAPFQCFKLVVARPRTQRQIVASLPAKLQLVAKASWFRRFAGPLTDVSHLRFQAVFLMGAGGSGKGFAGQRWMKYMPGAPSGGYPREQMREKQEQLMDEAERGLTNLNFAQVLDKIRQKGIEVELLDTERVKIPFRLYTYDQEGRQTELDPQEWERQLSPEIYQEVAGLSEAIFGTPMHELPTYWRQVNPDLYKEELAGYVQEQPGYVHEMSAEMSKSYFGAVLESGDPLFVDGTGANLGKMERQMQDAREHGYSIALVLVIVPLTVNQIRNATRARNVDPMVVVGQWKVIKDNFPQLRGIADKSKVIINRDDERDRASYAANADKINEFINKKTEGRYPTLYDLIAEHAPDELSEWGPTLKGEAAEETTTQKRKRRQEELGLA